MYFSGVRKAPRIFSATLILLLLTVSMMIAIPAHAAVANSSSSSTPSVTPPPTSLTPTTLTGYKAVGALPSSTSVLVTVGIPLQNEQELEYLNQEISTPGSPLYHDFLTQEQVQSFLPAAEYQVALNYLEQHGLTILSTSLDSIIIAQGSAAQVSAGLGLNLELYSNGTSSYYAATGTSPIAGAYVDVSNVTGVFLSHPPDLVTRATVSALDARSSQSNQTAPLEAYSLTDLESVYNATALYAKGDTGRGYTAGILDFYGDPYIAGELQYFDEINGLPSAPLNIIPIEAYNPSLGTVEDWAPEISLDVESVHSMAPGATIDLYIANGALPIAAAIAAIVAQDKVNDLSQSFGIPEADISAFDASTFDLNVVLADQYYLLGSAEGITFTSSTGDVGGSGWSGGPEGSVSYPSSSPYVVAVGGTTTYLAFEGSQVYSSYQTAWSNYGFVPNEINYGGGSGGISTVEPKPWYQSTLTSPTGFASGREVPDLSLNANVYPGVITVFAGNVTEITGGTSEASPLLAGLLILLMQSTKSQLGLINPSLYSLGESATLYTKAYHPITFGYTIPWVAQNGYNLATGWGAPNIGEIAHLGLGAGSPKSLSVSVTVTENGAAPTDVIGGSTLSIGAVVKNGATTVTTGTFTAELDTLGGTLLTVPLSYSAASGSWNGQMVTPVNASGISDLTVEGTSGSVSGVGFVTFFTGYLADFQSPIPDTPFDTQFGIPIVANMTTLDGTAAPAGRYGFTVSLYSLASNSYTPVGSVRGLMGGVFGDGWNGLLLGYLPDGPMMLTGTGGVWGYLPFFNGVDMQPTFIETSVLAEPGVVAPGQSIFVLATLLAPVNTPDITSAETGLPVTQDIEQGSNVTVSLVSQSGKTVASELIYDNSFLSTLTAIQGALTIPLRTAPGLYDVMLTSNYDSLTLGTSVNGSYFGQVYVGPSQSTPKISISPSVYYEGENILVSAKIAYSNGTSVKYGMYSATVYPAALQNYYNALTETIQIPLWYNVASGLWQGNVTLPSSTNSGGSIPIDLGALYLSGPYDVFISGLSADGVPSSTDISTQLGFTIQPYTYVSGETVSSLTQTSQVAFINDTIGGSASLTGDLFLGTTTLEGGPFVVSASQIQGTLNLVGAQVTLTGVTGGNIVAQNSKLVVQDSNLGTLQLTQSTISLNSSTYQKVTPSLPVISIVSPAQGQNYNSTSGIFTVSGQQVSSVSVYLDGVLISTMSGGPTSFTFPLNTATLAVGVHTLKVIATQQDGMSASSTVTFSSVGSLTTVESTVSSLSSQLASANNTIGSLTSRVSSDQSNINTLTSNVKSLTNGLIALGAFAGLALVVAVVAMGRRGAPRQDVPPPPPAPPPAPEPQPTM